MPAYGTPQSGGVLTSLQPGDGPYYLWNAESPAAGTSSIAFARGSAPGGGTSPTTFQIDFAAAPTAVLLIQGSNVDVDGEYQTLWTSTNTQHDNFTDTTAWNFYRAKLVSQSAGGAVTVTVKR